MPRRNTVPVVVASASPASPVAEQLTDRGVAMVPTVQSFPESGTLAENLDLTLPELARRLRKSEGAAYSYVVKSVRMWQNWPDSMGSWEGTSAVIFQQFGE